jgi:integrase
MPTPDELAVMVTEFEATAPRLRLAVLVAAFGGLRLSEWRALRRRDITESADGRYLVEVARQAQRITGKGWIVGPPKSSESVRVVTLPTRLTADVREHLAEHVGTFPDSLLFAPGGRSEYLNDKEFNAVWNRAREAAGVRVKEGGGWVSVVREHDLRAFAGTWHARSGATLRETMTFLGHATTQAAMLYQHVANDRAAELADAMPALPTAPKRVARIG